MTRTDHSIILTHLLDAHVHLSVAYYRGINEAGENGLSALHTTEAAIRDLFTLRVANDD